MIFLFIGIALGGDTARGGDPLSIATASHQFDAVLRIPRSDPGVAVGTTLLLADHASSAPITDARASATLSGPGDVAIDFTPVTPGVYRGNAIFPAYGDYAGALVVGAPAASGVLALGGVHRGDDPRVFPSAAPSVSGPAVVGILALIGVGALVAGGVGYAIGRRVGSKGAGTTAAIALFALASGAERVSAHGGEAHGGEAQKGGDAGTRGTVPIGVLTLPMESQFLVGLRTSHVQSSHFAEAIPALGALVARAGGAATVRAPIAGELVAPPAGFPSPGAEVRAGQELATIRELVGGVDRAALGQARREAATAAAEASRDLALAERDAVQAPGLVGAISAREDLARQQAVAVARARLAEAERALAGLDAGRGVILRAPVSGRLGANLGRPGDHVQAGDPLFRVTDSTGLWVEVHVPEGRAGGLRAGSEAKVFATAFPGVSLSGVLLDPGQEADPTTGTLTVTLAVDGLGHALHPGMSVTAWLSHEPTRDALTVPDSAVVESEGRTLGFVKVGPEQFEIRELRLGTRAGDVWEVLAGVAVGERIVVEGTYPLRSIAGR